MADLGPVFARASAARTAMVTIDGTFAGAWESWDAEPRRQQKSQKTTTFREKRPATRMARTPTMASISATELVWVTFPIPSSLNNFDSASLSSFAASGELLLGGTPVPGLVIAGGTVGAVGFGPSLEIDGESADAPNQLVLSSIGIAVDYYFLPHDGFHAQAFVGYGFLQADGSTENPDGVVSALDGGYACWIGKQRLRMVDRQAVGTRRRWSNIIGRFVVPG